MVINVKLIVFYIVSAMAPEDYRHQSARRRPLREDAHYPRRTSFSVEGRYLQGAQASDVDTYRSEVTILRASRGRPSLEHLYRKQALGKENEQAHKYSRR